jgi:hypothetical protein
VGDILSTWNLFLVSNEKKLVLLTKELAKYVRERFEKIKSRATKLPVSDAACSIRGLFEDGPAEGAV